MHLLIYIQTAILGKAWKEAQGHQQVAPAGPLLASLYSKACTQTQAPLQKMPPRAGMLAPNLGSKYSSTQTVPAINSHVYVMPTDFNIHPQASAPSGTLDSFE